MSASRRPAVVTRSFRAMGSAVELVIVGGDPRLATAARHSIEELERRWSRFLADSDITRFNLSRGSAVAVAGSTVTLVEAMKAGWVATGGAYDPTLLAPLVGLGDAASRHDAGRVTLLPPDALPRADLRTVHVDRQQRTLRAPSGVCLDPGGIGKGLAADLVAGELIASGARGALVCIGGDLAAVGDAPRPGGWMIAAGGARRPICLARGGVATSGTAVRSWSVGGRRVHHLLDPATLTPAGSGETGRRDECAMVEATVVAGDARWAEVWTKALMVGGASETLTRLDAIGLAARVVRADGSAVCNESWHAFVVSHSTDTRRRAS